jgi:colanic acid/amylovoran biosynthesis glycosyltransferase
MIRVLHSMDTFLSLSENWIYPQIVGVRDVKARVICDHLRNLETFPLQRSRLIGSVPPWWHALGIPKFCDVLASRAGKRSSLVDFKIRCWRPDIIHAHFGSLGWNNLTRKRRMKIPLVTSFYGWDAWFLPKTRSFWQDRYRELFPVGEAFLVEGPAMRQRLIELGCAAEKVHIQRIGVDLASLPFEARDFTDNLRVVMLGRFIEKKGLIDGLRSCAEARTRGINLNVTIIGDASANDPAGLLIKKELHALAAGSKLAGHVRFTGFLPLKEVRTTLGAHDIFLCPSKHACDGDAEGGSPVALTEAMASGLLCIGTRHCDIPEVILDGRTGYLCAEGDVTGMADRLAALPSASNRLLELVEAGRRHVEEHFSLATQLEKLRGLYQSIIS